MGLGFINHLITGGPHLVWISNSGFMWDVTLKNYPKSLALVGCNTEFVFILFYEVLSIVDLGI